MDETSAQDGAVPRLGVQRRIAELFDGHAGWMFRHALMILGDHAAAEDAVQRVFAKLTRMGSGVERIASPEPYLRQAVRRECYRIGPRQAAKLGRPLLEPIDPARPDDGTREELEAAMRELPAEQREVVYLKVYEGMTFEQVAQAQNVSVNTAASRYRYAIEKLRSALDARG